MLMYINNSIFLEKDRFLYNLYSLDSFLNSEIISIIKGLLYTKISHISLS